MWPGVMGWERRMVGVGWESLTLPDREWRDWFIGAELGALTKEKCVMLGGRHKVPAHS